MLIKLRRTWVHFASSGMAFPCESGARLELLGLLPYTLRLDPGEVPHRDGEVP